MRAPLPLTLAIAAVALLGDGCRCGSSPVPNAIRAGFGVDPAPGEQAPALELTDLDGAKVSLAKLKGQVVVVNFWATWCPPCREEMPSLVALGKELAARHPGKFKLLAVSLDEKAEAVRAYLKAPPFNGDAGGIAVALDTRDQATT